MVMIRMWSLGKSVLRTARRNVLSTELMQLLLLLLLLLLLPFVILRMQVFDGK